MTLQSVIAAEESITWLIAISALPRYVRQTVVFCPRRSGRVKFRPGWVVGYSNLRAKSDRRQRWGFYRRVFWLAPHDPYDGGDGGGAPCEAVDPMTVAPGRPGEMTDRAWGRPPRVQLLLKVSFAERIAEQVLISPRGRGIAGDAQRLLDVLPQIRREVMRGEHGPPLVESLMAFAQKAADAGVVPSDPFTLALVPKP